MRERQLADAFVELADTLVDDFDLMDFLHQVTVRCSQVLGVAAAGLLLTDQRGALRVAAASTEETRLLELLQLQTDEGPCPECFHSGEAVAVPDLSSAADRWPRFVAQAAQSGFASVHALPMRLRTDVIGALNLFGARPGKLDDHTIQLGQALADVATIGLLQARAIRHHETLAEQLQTALNSRIIIEQAKGVIAERRRIDMDEAFTLLRETARRENRRLSELARAVVDGTEPVLPERSTPMAAGQPPIRLRHHDGSVG
ncbi:GAF and ANTAR domain-containing protein [Catellatospora sichuanensis]|uniref:GAF and ANTAR domain-containing protein n=1 Tax=Catellatospora sichuanensis TaxID=1969805 RepID=UPI001181DD15|nr:GAF and ANTAR domain-containing protein [Catellatospora sichuanensis]